MKTKASSILLVVLFTFVTASAQTLMKIGADNNFVNFYLLTGLLLYGLGTIMFIIALKGGELSVLYPIISLSFIWVFLVSFFFLNEQITLTKNIGIVLIIGGVGLLGVKR